MTAFDALVDDLRVLLGILDTVAELNERDAERWEYSASSHGGRAAAYRLSAEWLSGALDRAGVPATSSPAGSPAPAGVPATTCPVVAEPRPVEQRDDDPLLPGGAVRRHTPALPGPAELDIVLTSLDACAKINERDAEQWHDPVRAGMARGRAGAYQLAAEWLRAAVERAGGSGVDSRGVSPVPAVDDVAVPGATRVDGDGSTAVAPPATRGWPTGVAAGVPAPVAASGRSGGGL